MPPTISSMRVSSEVMIPFSRDPPALPRKMCGKATARVTAYQASGKALGRIEGFDRYPEPGGSAQTPSDLEISDTNIRLIIDAAR